MFITTVTKTIVFSSICLFSMVHIFASFYSLCFLVLLFLLYWACYFLLHLNFILNIYFVVNNPPLVKNTAYILPKICFLFVTIRSTVTVTRPATRPTTQSSPPPPPLPLAEKQWNNVDVNTRHVIVLTCDQLFSKVSDKWSFNDLKPWLEIDLKKYLCHKSWCCSLSFA